MDEGKKKTTGLNLEVFEVLASGTKKLQTVELKKTVEEKYTGSKHFQNDGGFLNHV